MFIAVPSSSTIGTNRTYDALRESAFGRRLADFSFYAHGPMLLLTLSELQDGVWLQTTINLVSHASDSASKRLAASVVTIRLSKLQDNRPSIIFTPRGRSILNPDDYQPIGSWFRGFGSNKQDWTLVPTSANAPRQQLVPSLDALTLEIKDYPEIFTNVVLSYEASLDIENNRVLLAMGEGVTPVEIPDACVDALRLVVHQLHLYQSTAMALRDLPKSDAVDNELQLYISIAEYLASIVTAFKGELGTDNTTSSNTKWRSAHLDFHIALALEGNAFTQEQQTIALKAMKRSWNHFREKRTFKKVQERAGMHKAFCLNGDNMCGGPFEHTREQSALIADTIQTLQSEPEVEIKKEKVVRFDNPTPSFSVEITQRPPQNASGGSKSKSLKGRNIKATAQSVSNAQDSSDNMVVDLQDDPPKRISGAKSKKSGQGGPRKSITPASGSGQPRSSLLASDEEESHSERVANRFESKADAKKTYKPRKAVSKGKRPTRKGKNKDAVLEAESEEEQHVDARTVAQIDADAKLTARRSGSKKGGNRIIESEDEEEEDHPTATAKVSASDLGVGHGAIESHSGNASEDGLEELDDTILPTWLENWEDWNQIAFDEGNSQILLKLGAWMLLRFRQLAMIPMDADLNGLVIPQSPRGMNFNSENDFYEALGMERLYSAIAHIDTRPRYMRYLLHRLGRSLASADDADGRSNNLAVGSPPAVTIGISMMSDISAPWMPLNSGVDDDTAGDTTDEQGIVTDAMHEMAIDSDGVLFDESLDKSALNDGKRKRTSSQSSPPKKDGGRGPSKRPKPVVQSRSASVPPIPSSTVLVASTASVTSTVLVPSTPEAHASDAAIRNVGNASGEDDEIDAVGDVDHEQSFSSVAADPSSITHSIAVVESSSTAANANDWLENMISPPS
ncbi:uncharacterized protein EDB91DRAFT_1090035 [Suillus paluster]|uniref:uncharacterized protein n=1 Tax=Suillus paluster TaxID=48578 RepID=UPI001B87DDC3|nr:uncharacterized protein EDB91DRAFT_1090035 [Suillus paluster]KAG1718477.1 hypothetical protein EDB91DRAFT_1090035 [Suillus paluster]